MTKTTNADITLRARAPVHDDDDGISISPSLSKSSSASSSAAASPEELIDQLTELGFDGSAAFIIMHGADRVSQAVARALSRPEGAIKNLPGYIRSLVTTRGPIPKPEKPRPEPMPKNKYTNGKYGHLVKH